MAKRIQLLEATLRDGGFALEDAQKNKLYDYRFSDKTLERITDCLVKSKVDIIEVGAIEISIEDKTGFAIYQTIEEASRRIPTQRDKGQKFAVLYRGPDTPLDDIPRWNPSLCELVRVILRYSELEKSLDFCSALSQKGYKVCVQPMLTMRYAQNELEQVIAKSNDMGAYAVYFVDSYGYMQNEDIFRLFEEYDKGLNNDIRIGFHGHNNMGLAFSNTQTFLNIDTDRELMVDACVLGLGQGAGNLQTEVIADELNRSFGKHYDFDAILELCEIMDQYWTKNLWGYSVERFIPARHKAAYKYAVAMRYHYGMSFKEIDHVLSQMSLEEKQRYTVQALENFIQRIRG